MDISTTVYRCDTPPYTQTLSPQHTTQPPQSRPCPGKSQAAESSSPLHAPPFPTIALCFLPAACSPDPPPPSVQPDRSTPRPLVIARDPITNSRDCHRLASRLLTPNSLLQVSARNTPLVLAAPLDTHLPPPRRNHGSHILEAVRQAMGQEGDAYPDGRS